MKNTNSKEFKAQVRAYLMARIPDVQTIAAEYDQIIEDTDKARVNWVVDTFNSEYGNAYDLRRWPNRQERFAEWLMGLPSAIHIDYMNYRIIEIAKQWGSLPADATEKQEDKIVANWFNFISFKFWQLHETLNK